MSAVKPVIKFRNYTPQNVAVPSSAPSKPQTEALSEDSKPTASLESQPKVINRVEEPPEKEATQSFERLDPIKRELLDYQDQDEINIIPKKANWDLKNMVAKKIEKLNRRTQLAIVEMLREKMKNEEEDDG